MVYIIVIEYNDTNVSKILDSLIQMGTCIQLTEHSFLLDSSSTAFDVRNQLRDFFPSLDRIFVTTVQVSAAWRNTISSNEKIKEIYHGEE